MQTSVKKSQHQPLSCQSGYTVATPQARPLASSFLPDLPGHRRRGPDARHSGDSTDLTTFARPRCLPIAESEGAIACGKLRDTIGTLGGNCCISPFHLMSNVDLVVLVIAERLLIRGCHFKGSSAYPPLSYKSILKPVPPLLK